MFGRYHSATNPYLNPRAGGDPDVWTDLDNRRREHRSAAIKLAVGMAVFAVAGLALDTGFFIFTLAFVPFLLLELWMVRRSRSTGKIPDFGDDATNGPQHDADAG